MLSSTASRICEVPLMLFTASETRWPMVRCRAFRRRSTPSQLPEDTYPRNHLERGVKSLILFMAQ